MMTITNDNQYHSRCVDNNNNNVHCEQIGNTFYMYVEPHQIEDSPCKSTRTKGRIGLYLTGTVCMLMFTVMYTMLSVIIWLLPSYQMNQILGHIGNGRVESAHIMNLLDDTIPRIVTGILMIHVTVCYGYYYYYYNNNYRILNEQR